MNPFIWIMALRGLFRAAKAYDESTPEDKAAFKARWEAQGSNEAERVARAGMTALKRLAAIVIVLFAAMWLFFTFAASHDQAVQQETSREIKEFNEKHPFDLKKYCEQVEASNMEDSLCKKN